ncbi:hypothetical protein ACLOJK_001814 [Asimina triloba]
MTVDESLIGKGRLGWKEQRQAGTAKVVFPIIKAAKRPNEGQEYAFEHLMDFFMVQKRSLNWFDMEAKFLANYQA